MISESDLRRSVCSVITDNSGSGFFIKFLKPVRGLITNNHVLNENFIKNEKSFKIFIENSNQKEEYEIKIKSDKFIFTSKLIDVTFVPLSDDEIEEINPFFLEAEHSKYFENKPIFIYQYPGSYSHGQQLKIAYGEIIEIEGFNCYHSVSTTYGSSGSPLINSKNFKIIGIHKGSIKNESEKYKKLIEKHHDYFSKNQYINYATKINIVEYAILLFYNNKNINLKYGIMYEARDIAKNLTKYEKKILKKHDLIPKNLYYIDEEKEKIIYFKNNPLFLFEGNPDLCIINKEKEEKILFCRTNHGWYFTINPQNKEEYSLDEIKTYKWSIIYQKNFEVSDNKISKKFSNMQIVLILWLKLTEFKYLLKENRFNGTENNINKIFLDCIANSNISKMESIIEYANQKNITLPINEQNIDGNYPLLFSVYNDDIEATRLLIKYANKNNIILKISERNNNGECPLLMGINNNIEIAKLLINYAQKQNIKFETEMEKEIKKIFPNYKNKNNDYKIQNYEIFEREIENNSNQNLKKKEFNGMKGNINEKFLDIVAQNNISKLKLLIKYTDKNNIILKINKKDKEGNYPILKSILNNNIELAEVLIDYASKNNIILNFYKKRNIFKYSENYVILKSIYESIVKYNSKVFLKIIDCFDGKI